jgi:hypothetical protein
MPLRHADSLFDILRVLRGASRPISAASFARETTGSASPPTTRLRRRSGC